MCRTRGSKKTSPSSSGRSGYSKRNGCGAWPRSIAGAYTRATASFRRLRGWSRRTRSRGGVPGPTCGSPGHCWTCRGHSEPCKKERFRCRPSRCSRRRARPIRKHSIGRGRSSWRRPGCTRSATSSASSPSGASRSTSTEAFGADDAARARRRLHASATYLGMVRVDGDLDPETGECLLTALRAVVDAESRSGASDDRTPAQRRADALGEICRQWLDRSDRPMIGGERPHVTLTVDAGMLAGYATGSAELDQTGPVPREVAKRHVCDASLMRVVLSGRSQPLDVGRRTPIVPPSMRRAVIVRDRRCRFPRCDRPQSWCDAHHIVHWADGGPTAVGNLLLLCRRHHRMVHMPGGFRLEFLEDGRPVFRRPDGSLLEDRGPP